MMSQRLDGLVDGSGACADIRVQLGIYVFGAITPADRALVVQHLATCPNCRDELVGLAALPGLLHRPSIAAAAFPDDDPQPAPIARRRRWRWGWPDLRSRDGRSGCLRRR
jgi:anti-sigma factor RsiW